MKTRLSGVRVHVQVAVCFLSKADPVVCRCRRCYFCRFVYGRRNSVIGVTRCKGKAICHRHDRVELAEVPNETRRTHTARMNV